MPAKHPPEEAPMADEGPAPITQEAVDAFTDKMLAWGEELPVEERAVLLMLLNRASSDVDEEEVAGFNLNLGLSPSQMAAAKTGMAGGTFEGWSKGPSWLRTWSQALPKT
jgi:hypothetical protein